MQKKKQKKKISLENTTENVLCQMVDIMFSNPSLISLDWKKSEKKINKDLAFLVKASNWYIRTWVPDADI